MPKIVHGIWFVVFSLVCLLLVQLFTTDYSLFTTHARTTPEDIINSKRANYELKVSNYSQTNKQKLENLSVKIAKLNQKKTKQLEEAVLMQGLILDEYTRRINYQEDGGKDGIHRNLAKEVENTRYWITFAHEAVAYQAGKVYIINLSSEKNIKNDALVTINQFQSDLNYVRSQVLKSQQLLENIIGVKNEL